MNNNNNNTIFTDCWLSSSTSTSVDNNLTTSATTTTNDDGTLFSSSNESIYNVLLCISNRLETLIMNNTNDILAMDTGGGGGGGGGEFDTFTNSNTTTYNNDTTINEKIWMQINDSIRSYLVIYAAAMVFFMQAGFAMVCAGSVQKKNIQNTMLKNLLDACSASIAFFCIGYAFAFGGDDNDIDDSNNTSITFMGTTNFFLMGVSNEQYSFWLYQFAFSAASATIVAGALAERCQMGAYMYYSVLLSGWVYPIVVHAIWSSHGFLSPHLQEPLWDTGMIDFSGSGVVHVTGGLTALFAALILGPRTGRFHDVDGTVLEHPRTFPGSSVALQMLGTFILWYGWYGFNSGNAILVVLNETTTKVAALAAVNTTLAAGVAGAVSLLCNLWFLDRTTGEAIFELKYAMNGVLSGLVAVTGSCGVIEPWAAIITGFLSGINYNIGSRFLVYVRIDDAVDAVPVHLFNGVLGVLIPAFLASPSRLLDAYGRNIHCGLFYTGDFVLLGMQLIGLLFISGWVMFIMLPFFIWLDFMGMFRSDPLEEIVGLDTSYHGGLALLLRPDTEEIPSAEQIEQLQQLHRSKSSAASASRQARLHAFRHADHGRNTSPLDSADSRKENDNEGEGVEDNEDNEDVIRL